MRAMVKWRRMGVVGAVAILAVAVLSASHGVAAAQNAQEGDQVAESESVDTPPEKPKRPPIYDESANAEEQLQAALIRAKKENRRVLIQWGANWCGWCHYLHELMKSNQEIARKLMYEYDVVLVDIGKMDKNLDLLERFEVDLKTNGVPFLTVLDTNGNVVVNQETSVLEKEDKDDPGHKPEAVLEFLSKYSAEPLEARELLATATEKAKSEHKIVFLRWGAPWCGWCHRMDAWMENPDVHSILNSAFVHLKIDTERMIHGQELLDEYCSEPSGIPWFVFIDPNDQKVLATSDGPQGNVGFPFEDFEIDHFCDMLGKCNGRISDAQIASLKKSLLDNREADRARQAEAEASAATTTSALVPVNPRK